MADNYLERRMEDLRSGRIGATAKGAARAAAQRKGYISTPFPPRRVLVAGGADGIGRAVAMAFVKAGCRTAVFGRDKAEGERMAHDHGVRFHHVDAHDPDAVAQAMENLFKAWNDLDAIVICPGHHDALPSIAGPWAGRRAALPYPNDFGGRLIILSFRESPQPMDAVASILRSYAISISGVTGCDAANADGVARMCLFLVSPGNDFVSSVTCV